MHSTEGADFRLTLEELVVGCLLDVWPESHLHPPNTRTWILKHLIEVFGRKVGPDVEHEHAQIGQATHHASKRLISFST